MKSLLTLFLVIYSLCLFSQSQSVQVIDYEGESYFLYPDNQKIHHNPSNLIWEEKISVSKEELKQYKPNVRRFFRERSIVTKFPIDGNWIQLFDVDSFRVARLFQIENGLPNGEFKKFNEYGDLVEKGRFLNGSRSGRFHFYPDSTRYAGIEYSTGEYEMSDSAYYKRAFWPYYHVIDEGKKGRWEVRRPDGTMKQIEHYAKGKLDGQQLAFYANGETSYELYYENGKLQGTQRFWYKNGLLKETSVYSNDLRSGRLMNWYEDGKPKCDLVYDQDEIVDGDCNLYYSSGTLFGKGKLEGRIRIGDWTFWHENGTKKAEGEYQAYTTNVCMSGIPRPYLHSIQVGRWNYWYGDSNPLASGNYGVIKSRISRGEIYESTLTEDSWTCNDMEGGVIPCDQAKSLMELALEKNYNEDK